MAVGRERKGATGTLIWSSCEGSSRVGDGVTVPNGQSVGMPSRQRRSLVVKTASVTAALTFIGTQTAGWMFDRAADSIAMAATPVLRIESSGPIATPWDVTIPQKPGEVEGALVRAEAIARWAINQGGGPSNEVRIELTIGGNREQAVLVEGVRAIDVECTAAPRWTNVEATVGGEVPTRHLVIDFDSGNYEGLPQEDPYYGYGFRFPLQVSRSDLEFFSAQVRTRESDCSFRLEIHFREGGSSGSSVVDDGGVPFRVVSGDAAVSRMEWHSIEEGFWSPERIAR